jgi:cell fate regulator YaaT (PSP1 superfamily)
MPEVVGVVFTPGGPVQRFDPHGLQLVWNERVICRTQRGHEYGRVVQGNYDVDAELLTAPLRPVVRKATPEDEATRQRQQAEEAMQLFKRVARDRRVPIKPYVAEQLFDGGRIVVQYGAEEKVDLRGVAAEVGRRLGIRVEARQVGPRDGARSVGSVGLCGPTLCSSRFPSHEQPVTLRMAKDQDVPMNPGRITGLCGRLRCCLAFEHPVYRSFRDRAPAVGRKVRTPDGPGVVRSYKVPADAVVVRLDGSDTERQYVLADVQEKRRER